MDNLDIEGKSAAISVRQLKLFETTARLASVRRAADECSLSQPAVTQALAKLEDQVGAKLLERRSSGSYLNKCGEIFYPRAVRFFTQLEEAICELAVPGGPATVPIIAKRFSRAHLRCLIAVVDSGSFSQAASLLQINQSSLQRIARTIEKNLGKTIFCGAATGKIVTPAGEQFGRKLKLALREIDWGVQEIDAALGNSTATIIVGAMPSGGSVLLASVLDEFVSAHPATDVKIVTENAPELLKSLASGGVDLAIGLAQATMDSEFNFESLAKTPYRVVARRGHPLARQSKLTFNDLLQYRWIIGTPGSNRRACFDHLFAAARIPRAAITTCALPIIHHLLESSDRLTLMTSYELKHDSNALVALPFENNFPEPSIGITTRADWLPMSLHNDFTDLLRKRTADAAASPKPRQARRKAAAV